MKYGFLLGCVLFLSLLISFQCGPLSPGETSQQAPVFDTTYSQTGEGPERTIRVSDFNRDGALDTLSWFDSSGSGFGGRFIRLTDGKVRTSYEVNTSGCFCQIRQEVFFPGALDGEQQTPFREALHSALPPVREQADPTLRWIIHGLYHNRMVTGKTYFEKVIPFPNEWATGTPELPSLYSLEMSADSLRFLHGPAEEEEELPEPRASKGILVYYGQNHYDKIQDSLVSAAKSPPYQIWKTKHALLAKKDQTHKWIFACDLDLTGAPEKLRWPSIGQVAISGQYAFFQQLLPTDDISTLWIIDMEKGVCGKTNIVLLSDALPFHVSGDQLQVRVEGGFSSYVVSVIVNELEHLTN